MNYDDIKHLRGCISPNGCRCAAYHEAAHKTREANEASRELYGQPPKHAGPFEDLDPHGYGERVAREVRELSVATMSSEALELHAKLLGVARPTTGGSRDDYRQQVLQILPLNVEFLALAVGGGRVRGGWWVKYAVRFALWLLDRAGYEVIR